MVLKKKTLRTKKKRTTKPSLQAKASSALFSDNPAIQKAYEEVMKKFAPVFAELANK